MMEEKTESIKDLVARAEAAEKNNDPSNTIALYKNITERDKLNIVAYDKLMKLFRKSKEYKKELSIINKAVKAYEAYYKKHKPKHSKTVDTISSKLNKSFGLVDKKGINVYDPEPIGKWKKRRLIVEKKLQ